MRRYSFIKLDVFTRRPLEGNQLAVLTDARGLTSAQMQAVAREMRLSETTFILPRHRAIEKKRGIKVRIFTTDEELPFAGHPTLGTAFALRGRGAKKNEVVLDLTVGSIPVSFSKRNGALFSEMRQRDPEFGVTHSPEAVARALALPVSALDSRFPVQTVSTGVPFTIVPLASLETLRTIAFDFRRADEYMENSDAKFFYLVCRQTEDRATTLRARMIFYSGEDPATGSAAGCAAAWMVAHGILAPEKQGLIEQGVEMKRPSLIYVRAAKTGDRIHDVRVGGHVVEIMRGTVAF